MRHCQTKGAATDGPRGPGKWNYFCLYVILDIFSRYVPGWLLASRESAELAEDLGVTQC